MSITLAPSPLIAVAGPTGAGKSELALRLALDFGGEIVNFDSVQVYRGLDIGSAKTPLAERLGVAHHLLDIVPPESEMTAGEYARRAAAVLAQIRARHALPLLVGGTGFYLRALLDGLSPAPRRNEELRRRLARVAERRPAALHKLLLRRAPEAAARIHPNDRQKLIRALELAGTAVKPRRALEGFRVLKIGLNPARGALCEKLDRRARSMFENGLLEETRALLASGGGKALTTLGYRQAVAVLAGEMPLGDAIAECQTRTRQYAKRQMTWFRADSGFRWLAGFGGEARIQREATALLKEFLG